jgi:hypothetical protein
MHQRGGNGRGSVADLPETAVVDGARARVPDHHLHGRRHNEKFADPLTLDVFESGLNAELALDDCGRTKEDAPCTPTRSGDMRDGHRDETHIIARPPIPFDVRFTDVAKVLYESALRQHDAFWLSGGARRVELDCSVARLRLIVRRRVLLAAEPVLKPRMTRALVLREKHQIRDLGGERVGVIEKFPSDEEHANPGVAQDVEDLRYGEAPAYRCHHGAELHGAVPHLEEDVGVLAEIADPLAVRDAERVKADGGPIGPLVKFRECRDVALELEDRFVAEIDRVPPQAADQSPLGIRFHPSAPACDASTAASGSCARRIWSAARIVPFKAFEGEPRAPCVELRRSPVCRRHSRPVGPPGPDEVVALSSRACRLHLVKLQEGRPRAGRPWLAFSCGAVSDDPAFSRPTPLL